MIKNLRFSNLIDLRATFDSSIPVGKTGAQSQIWRELRHVTL